MLDPVVCVTCGMPLDVAQIYRICCAEHPRELHAVPTRALADGTQTKNHMNDILDALRIDKCCRMHLVSNILFKDRY